MSSERSNDGDGDALRITFRVYSHEDEAIFNDLARCQGASRVRRLRALMRAGYAALQSGYAAPVTSPQLVPASVLNFPPPAKTPEALDTRPGSGAAFLDLDLDPGEFGTKKMTGTEL